MEPDQQCKEVGDEECLRPWLWYRGSVVKACSPKPVPEKLYAEALCDRMIGYTHVSALAHGRNIDHQLTFGNPVDPLECTMKTGNGPSCSGVNALG